MLIVNGYGKLWLLGWIVMNFWDVDIDDLFIVVELLVDDFLGVMCEEFVIFLLKVYIIVFGEILE